MRLRRLGWIVLLLTATSTLGAILMQKLDLFGVQGQELAAYDGGLSFWTKEGARSKDIVMLLVDDQTFSGVDQNYKSLFGTWVYKRNFWAFMLNYLKDCGVKAVAFDFYFTESSQDDVYMEEPLAEYKKLGIPVFAGFDFDINRPELPKAKAVNRFLHPEVSDAIQKATEEIVIPVSVGTGSASTNQPPVKSPDQVAKEEAEQRIPWTAQALALPVDLHNTEAAHMPDWEGVNETTGEKVTRELNPNPPLHTLWPYMQFGSVSTEFFLDGNQDGKMRYTSLVYADKNNAYGTLPLVMAATLLKAEKVKLSSKSVKIGPRELSLNGDGTGGIHYGGFSRNRFKNFSWYYALQDAVFRQKLIDNKQNAPAPKFLEAFKDKIVFVALAKSDNKATPLEKDPPAVVKHAAVLENLLFSRFITDAPFWVSVVIAMFLALLSIVIVLVVESAYIEMIWPLVVFFGFYIIPGYILCKYQIHILSVMPALAGSIAGVLAGAYKNFIADQSRQELKALFGQYMDKEVVEMMVEHRQLPSLLGEEREITIFASKIYKFSECMDQAQIDLKTRMRILNSYLQAVTDILIKEGACIDKYIGDEVRAFFGAPLWHPDHALRACRAAWAISQLETKWQQDLQVPNTPPLVTHIGVNTACVLVGNMGSNQLIDYTAIGDGVDATVWMKEANTTYQTTILVGPETQKQAREVIDVVFVTEVSLPGQSTSLPFYQLRGIRQEAAKDT